MIFQQFYDFELLSWSKPESCCKKKQVSPKKKVACPDSRAIGIAHYQLPRKQNNQKASVACFVLTRQVMTIMYGTSGRELWVGTLFYLFLGTFIKYVHNFCREVDLRNKIILISIFVRMYQGFLFYNNKWLHFQILTSNVNSYLKWCKFCKNWKDQKYEEPNVWFKKLGQSAAVYYYCRSSQFFWIRCLIFSAKFWMYN